MGVGNCPGEATNAKKDRHINNFSIFILLICNLEGNLCNHQNYKKLNLYHFLSKRIHKGGKDSFSTVVTKISITSISLGLAIMIISFAILDGFKKNIQEKIFSFSSHMAVTKYDLHKSYEESPLSKNWKLYNNNKLVSEVNHIQVFSHKPGLLKTDEEVIGVVLKGIGKDFNIERFKTNIIKGSFITIGDSSYSPEILVSKRIAFKLKLDVGDTVLMYFVQNPPRFRKLVIKGWYETGLEEFDDLIILGDIKINQKLNDWQDSLVGGFEIFIKDFGKLDYTAEKVFEVMDYDMQLEKITDKYIQIFDWLSLLNRNVLIFLILILFVASFNMVSTIFIMIMERTNMIGMLKALGATNRQVQWVFIFNGLNILLKGLLYGNIAGIGFCALQYYFKLIPLDEENYYMNAVPIEWDWLIIAGLNLLTFLLISVILVFPIMVIAKIKPIKAIRFD